ncbi:MAG TPA: nitroreductase family protein [Patescibacteria group bacterium]|nr:nitroreductase family protein [Patescibacteria group bacterium]
MIDAIKKRRSIRQYLNEEILDDKLKEILTSAMYAPSANAIYPWELVVVRNLETKEELSKTTPWSSHVKDASVVIVVVGDPEKSSDWVEDCSIVATHLWLEIVNQGFGSCWTQIRGNDTAEKQVKEILSIPDDLTVLCLMPIGVPAKDMPEHSEDNFDISKVKNEKYK